MHTKLEQKFRQLEADREKLMNGLWQVSSEKLNRKPQPDKWSALQVIYHINQAEQLTLQYITRKLTGKKAFTDPGPGNTWRNLLLRLLLWSPARFKAPAVLGQVPDHPELTAVSKAWAQTRQDIRHMLAQFPDELTGKQIFRHPRAGMLTIHQTLDFIGDHAEHHYRQIRRLVR